MPLLVVTAALLAGCSAGGSGADRSADPAPPTAATATATAVPAAEPSPTAASSPPTAAEIAELVTNWYEFGGEAAMAGLISEIVAVEAARTPDDLGYVTVDFGPLFDAIEEAAWPGTIPDLKARTAWSAALGHLEDGANAVLSSSPDLRLFQSRQEAEQAYEGWRTFDKGVKELKAVQSRLRSTFSLRPSSDPWKAPR